MTASTIVTSSAAMTAIEGAASCLPTRMAWLAKSWPTERRPFMTRVEPLDTRSTMPSARPIRGATSTAPLMVTMSVSMPSFEKLAAAALGLLVARRSPARSSSRWAGEALGTAASGGVSSRAPRARPVRLPPR
jgi:hypothetical protein